MHSSAPSAFRFAEAVRTVAMHCRRHGYAVPGFRSPPRLAGVDRTLRRRADGGATVAVVLRGRPWVAVLADIIDGVVAANRLDGPAADRCRAVLWQALGGHADAAA